MEQMAFSSNMAIKKHVTVLRQLCKANKTVQRKLLVQGGKPLQHCLRECAVNLLAGNVPLSKPQFKRLKRYRNHIRELGRKKTSQKRRIQIEQQGGFLASLLLPIIGSVAASAIKTAIDKKKRRK